MWQGGHNGAFKKKDSYGVKRGGKSERSQSQAFHLTLSQYLLALTALAGYALRSTHVYSLPIPDVVSALTITLPPLAGVALELVLSLNEKLAARGQLQTSRIFQVVIAFFLVYESVLATLAGTHISPPGSLTCALREKWQGLFQRHEDRCIERIQDAFNCCGFMSTRDMAFPRQDGRGPDACMVRYERDQACFEPWREEERRVAVMLLVVPIAVFLWKVSAGSHPRPSTQTKTHSRDD